MRGQHSALRLAASRRALAALALVGAAACALAEAPRQVDVFSAGQDGYAFYRIPAIVTTRQGTLLAFCEGRKQGRGDAGDIDLLLRRSSDGGKSWSPLQVVWNDGANTCGNPAPLVDKDSGRVWLFSTWNLGSDSERMIMDGVSTDTRRVFVTSSPDQGVTWAKPADITSSVKHADWRWYATGPGHAIQLSSGRMVIPANHSVPPGNGHPYRSHVIVSDNAGKSWHAGGTVGEMTNESSAAELEDGRLYMNMRSYHGLNRRAVSWSKNGGESWQGVYLDPALVEPVCQASVLRHTTVEGKTVFVFSNPASNKRQNLTVRLSHDSCRTWNNGQLLHPGPSAYSDLCSLPGGDVGCLYERGDAKQPYATITFARMDMRWLQESSDAGAKEEIPQ